MLDMFGQSVGVQKAESAFPMLFLDSWISTKGSATPVTCSCGSFKKNNLHILWHGSLINLHTKQLASQDITRPYFLRMFVARTSLHQKLSLTMSLFHHVLYTSVPLRRKNRWTNDVLVYHMCAVSTGPKRCQNRYGQTQAQEYHPDRFAGLVWERNKCLALYSLTRRHVLHGAENLCFDFDFVCMCVFFSHVVSLLCSFSIGTKV